MTTPMTYSEVQTALARGETVRDRPMKVALTHKAGVQAGDIDRKMQAENAAVRPETLESRHAAALGKITRMPLVPTFTSVAARSPRVARLSADLRRCIRLRCILRLRNE
ncbi:hypothetical protein SLT36_26140 [Aminobacter sp. BA135]|uniref:hypothetical protein n=1 Tax=Aminobacter sp. BA135 TaxID=537596 RepID=UPI003D78B4F4